MRLKELIWFAQVRGSWDTPPWRPCWPPTTSTFHAQMNYLFNWFVYLHSPDVIAPSNRFHTRIWKDLQNPAMENLSFKPVCFSLIILQIHSPSIHSEDRCMSFPHQVQAEVSLFTTPSTLICHDAGRSQAHISAHISLHICIFIGTPFVVLFHSFSLFYP